METTRPLLGAHTSIAGGLDKAIIRGSNLGCDAIQIFTKNSNQWKERYLESKEIDVFQETGKRLNIDPVIAHSSYLINLASPDDENYEKSISAVRHELRRCEQLGIGFIVMHPGSHRGAGEKAGIGRIIQALGRISREHGRTDVRITLETTAGQGAALGHTFQQIARIMDGAGDTARLALCLDTCHAFAAGYEMRDGESYERLLEDVERLIGLQYLKVIHLNDSRRERGSLVDRHEEIGKGMIGLEPMRWIMKDARLRDVPKILETPGIGSNNNIDRNRETLQLLRSFAG